ncbi:hypothetical protein JW921_02165 [Candidatus Fermentibacterales bacterium]|nr:hypothetical protein [Candidatus Fermentibacterales bacterium]
MRYSLICLVAMAVSLALADPGDVVSVIPAPGGNPDGLTWVDGSLYITSDSDFMIYEIDPDDGTVLDFFIGYGDDDVLTGLTYDGTDLWSCSNQFIYKRSLPDGTVLDSIPAPNPTCNEGLAWDGSSIWSTNWNDDMVYELDPSNGDILSFFFPSGSDGATGLAWDGTYLWVSMQGSVLIYRMIPGDPTPVSFFLAPCDTPQDLAWDGEYLWVTEYVASGAMVYQIEPGEIGLSPATWGSIKTEF